MQRFRPLVGLLLLGFCAVVLLVCGILGEVVSTELVSLVSVVHSYSVLNFLFFSFSTRTHHLVSIKRTIGTATAEQSTFAFYSYRHCIADDLLPEL